MAEPLESPAVGHLMAGVYVPQRRTQSPVAGRLGAVADMAEPLESASVPEVPQRTESPQRTEHSVVVIECEKECLADCRVACHRLRALDFRDFRSAHPFFFVVVASRVVGDVFNGRTSPLC